MPETRPIKKRPILFVKEEMAVEPEQDEPVDLCIRPLKDCEEVIYVKKETDKVPIEPLRDITILHNDHISPEHLNGYISVKDDFISNRSLYNLLPGYVPTIRSTEPYYQPQHSYDNLEPYSSHCEDSLSPPPTMVQPYQYHHSQISHSNIENKRHLDSNHNYYQSTQMSGLPSHHLINHSKSTHNPYDNQIDNRNYNHRYVPYQLPAKHRNHLIERNPLSISPVPSHSSLHSYSSSVRNSISPASTNSSLNDDLYAINHHHIDQRSIRSVEQMEPHIHHTTADTVQRYQCPDCNKSYSTCSGLSKHQQFHCVMAKGSEAPKSFSCKYCEKTYTSLGALKMHIRTHTLPCKCHICGKAFSRPWLLQGHIRTHTGEKPFSCQYCHRAFADRSNLRAHLQTHSDVKKYSCSTCDKTFSRMSLLTKHTEGGCQGAQNISGHHHHIPSNPYGTLSD